MTLAPDVFPVSDMEDFASYLGLDGIDADIFYESYYRLNVDDEWDDDEYREEDKYANYERA